MSIGRYSSVEIFLDRDLKLVECEKLILMFESVKKAVKDYI